MSADVAAERAVLAGIYTYGQNAYLDAATMLTPSAFSDETNQALYRCYQHMFDDQDVKRPDAATVTAAIEKLGYGDFLKKPAQQKYIKSIFDTFVLQENIPRFASRVKNLSIARLLRRQMQEASITIEDITGDEPLSHILGVAEKCIFDFTSEIVSGDSNEPQLLFEGIREHLVDRMNNPVDMIGLPTPYRKYNEAIGGGMRKKAVTLLGARTGVGKSIIADNIALYTAKQKVPVLYVDTEMIMDDHWYRLGAHQSGVQINDLETGKAGAEPTKRELVMRMLGRVEGLPFHYINVSGREFADILAMIRRWVFKDVGFNEDGSTKDCLVVFDYIKTTSSSELTAQLQEYQLLGFMMTSLHNLAVRNDIPIFATIQLNRDGIDKESTDVVAGSDRIVWLTSNFTVFKPKSDEELQAFDPKEGTHKFVILKQRHGPGMKRGDYINMVMDGYLARVVEGKSYYELKKQAGETSINPKPAELVETDNIPFGDDKDEQQPVF